MTLVNLAKTDLKVGLRNYTYPIYLLSALAYGMIIRMFPPSYHATTAPLFLFMEPGLVGFMFVGAIIMFEKKDGVVGALSVTPLEWRDYYLAKAMIMVILGLAGAAVILSVGTGFVGNWPYVLLGVALTSIVYTFLGIGIAAKHRNLDDYFVPMVAIIAISLLPFAAYHNLLTGSWTKALYVIPSYQSLYLLQTGFKEVASDTLIIAIVALLVWALIAYQVAKTRFYKYAVEGTK